MERIEGSMRGESFFGDAARPAGDDDAADARQLHGCGVDGKNVTLNADLAHATREQMTRSCPPACRTAIPCTKEL